MSAHYDALAGFDPEPVRQRALERLQDGRPDISSMSAEDIETLICDLEIHQAELEVQNEELRRIQTELAMAHDRYFHLYEFAPVGYLTLDGSGVIEQINMTATVLCREDRHNLLGSRFERCIAREDRDACYVLLKSAACSSGKRETGEFRLACDDGVVCWVMAEVTYQSDLDQEVAGYRVTLSDITARKQAEESLRELNATLERRVARRTREVEHKSHQLRLVLNELSEAEGRERERLAGVLHDGLQQTLTGAKMQLKLAEGKIPDGCEGLEPVRLAIAYLDEAIEGARSLSHDLSPATLRMKGLMAGVRWLGEQMTEKHGLRVNVRTTGSDAAVPDPVKNLAYKVIGELLFNVVKHAEVDEADVDMCCSDHALEAQVVDRGRGFDPALALQHDNGTGLGLLSIRERIAMNDGRLEIVSAPGEGSRFRIVVPLGEMKAVEHVEVGDSQQGTFAWHDESARRQDRPRRVRSRSDKTRILLVDDHRVFRQGLAILLNNQPDFEVVAEAANGRQGVEAAGRWEPDVVLMDMTMPDMAGDEATRHIKHQFPEIHVIGLSMHDERDAAQQMLSAGAEAYLCKSGPPMDLLTVIRQTARQPSHR